MPWLTMEFGQFSMVSRGIWQNAPWNFAKFAAKKLWVLLITQFFTGQMFFLMPNQHCQSTEGNYYVQHGQLYSTKTLP